MRSGAVALWLTFGSVAGAQTVGTFRWQLLPYCNVVTLTVVQQGANYNLDGTDDQCGAAQKAGVVGIAFPNPDGTIGMSLNIVGPAGNSSHTDATITLGSLGGTWHDTSGESGSFVFTPGAAAPGNPRPKHVPPTVLTYSYDLAAGAYSAPIDIPAHLPIRMAGTQLTVGFRGVGAVDIISIPDANGQFLEWVGLHSTAGAAITQGFSGASGTLIVYLDFSHQVSIEVFSPTQVRVHNASAGQRTGQVTLTY